MNLPVSRRLDFSEIPVIDISALVSVQPGRQTTAGDIDQTVAKIRDACTDVGFFYISNHDFDQGLVSEVAEMGRQFFALSMDEKERIAIDSRLRGYLPLYYRSYEGEERAATSHQEGFWMGYDRPVNIEHPLQGPNQWPAVPQGLRKSMDNYLAAIEPISASLQRGFALALGLDELYFLPLFDDPTSRLKINHYPPQNNDITEHNLGVVPHTDSGGYTILWQDQHGGLQIQSKNGEWVGAPPIDNTFVVNIGNIMQYWSNGRFSSTPHRVINRGNNDRYSIPMFVNPNHGAIVEPLVNRSNPGFEPFLYGDYQVDLWRRTFPIASIP